MDKGLFGFGLGFSKSLCLGSGESESVTRGPDLWFRGKFEVIYKCLWDIWVLTVAGGRRR